MGVLLINQGTNAAVNFDLSGTVNTQVIAVGYGTLSTLGTLPNLPGGSIAVTSIPQISVGTIPQVSIGTLSNLPGGTVNLVQTVSTISSITTLPNIPGGTIGSVVGIGALPNIPGGTVGLITRVGNVGTIEVGTISALPNTPGGTLGLVTTVTTVSNLTNGSVAVTAGTITSIGTIGTLGLGSVFITNTTANPVPIQPPSSGQLNVGMLSGTLNVGTVVNNGGSVIAQLNPLPVTNTISHTGTSGTTAIGTLIGTASIGVGTAVYPTGIRIVAISGTPEVILAFGSQTNGNQVIHHGLYPAGGGIAYPVPYPHGYGTTNSPLTYQILSGAGTVSWDVDYFLHT